MTTPTKTPQSINLDTSRNIGVLPRGDLEELRIGWQEFKGKRFLSLRVWSKSGQVFWPVAGKGLTIRLGEVKEVSEVLLRAVQELETAEETHPPY